MQLNCHPAEMHFRSADGVRRYSRLQANLETARRGGGSTFFSPLLNGRLWSRRKLGGKAADSALL